MTIQTPQHPALDEKAMVEQAERALGDLKAVRASVGRVIFGQETVVEQTLVSILDEIRRQAQTSLAAPVQ